jgi:CheY-like chemotaxis protein
MNPRTLQVVLIEDNSSDVFLIGKALREAGLKFSLRTFTNGEEALEFVETLEESGVPDIILMDWNLPRVHGKDILQAMDHVRCLGKTPRVVLTSSQSPGDRKEVEQMGQKSRRCSAIVNWPGSEEVRGIPCSIPLRVQTRDLGRWG